MNVGLDQTVDVLVGVFNRIVQHGRSPMRPQHDVDGDVINGFRSLPLYLDLVSLA